jgi:PPK2 family polyphosphate:nucleotide phosphotransferase
MARRPYASSTDGSRKVSLAKLETDGTTHVRKEAGLEELETWGAELSELSNLLTYARQHALLVVLQGRDASGKDGSIRKILEFSNIQNAAVAHFEVPTEDERAHDFLWRAHRAVPPRGRTALFNRSHYEDVIAARVNKLVPEKTWKARYAHINAFERLLVDSDVIVVKFFLHVSRDEEVERLYAREKDPRTAWKLNPNDWRELPLWDEISAAYDDAINKCATPEAPWYLVPADKKWFRNLAVVQRLVLELRPYRILWLQTLKEQGQQALKEIRALRAKAEVARAPRRP